jgi:hypothetical protein
MPVVTIKPSNAINVRVNRGAQLVVPGINLNAIDVKINQGTQVIIPSTSVFSGAVNVQEQINEIYAIANASSLTANTAYLLANNLSNEIDSASYTANSAYSIARSASNTANIAYNTANAIANSKLNITGGEITGNLIVDGDFITRNMTFDAGTF